MNIQTIVYDEDADLARSIVMDLCNTSAVIACADGDAIDERDEAKLWECAVQSADACLHIFKTPQQLMSYIRMQHKSLLLDYRDKKKEPTGS